MSGQVIAKEDRSYLWLAGVVCFFAFLITKDIVLPKAVLLGMSLLSGLYLLFKGMSKPELVTYALVAYLPFSKELQGNFGGAAMALNFTNLLMIFLIIVWLTGRYSQGEPMWISTNLGFPIALFLLMGLISIIRGNYFGMEYLGTALVEYKRWITPILFYFLVLNTVKDRTIVRNVCIIMMIVTVVVSLMAIYDYMDAGSSSLENSRIGGIADQPNMLAAFFNYYMFLQFGFFLLNMNKPRYWLILIPFLLCFRGIMVTFSRGGYLSFALGMYAITFFRGKLMFLLMILLTVFVYFNPILIPAGVRYRMGQTFHGHSGSSYADDVAMKEENLESSAKSRVDIWKASMLMIKDNPMWGVGYGLFPVMLKYYLEGVAMDSHNTYILIAAEMGIPTLLIFLWIVFLIFMNTRRLYLTTHDPFARALALGWMGGIFGLLLSNMFGSRLDSQEVSSYLWILAALVTRLTLLDRKDRLAAQEGNIQSIRTDHGGSGKLDACFNED